MPTDDFDSVAVVIPDRVLAEIIVHIAAAWSQRETIEAYARLPAEVLAQNQDFVSQVVRDVNHVLEEKARDHIILRRSMSWFYDDNPSFYSNQEPDFSTLREVRIEIGPAARHSAPYSTFVIRLTALVIPAIPEHVRSGGRRAVVPDEAFNAAEQELDTSLSGDAVRHRPRDGAYPLDNLLADIDDLVDDDERSARTSRLG